MTTLVARIWLYRVALMTTLVIRIGLYRLVLCCCTYRVV